MMGGVSDMLSSKAPFLRYGILIIVIILWYSFIYDPLSRKLDSKMLQMESQAARIRLINKEFKKLRGINNRLKKAKSELARLEQQLVPGDTPQVVASNLQDLLLKKASEAGLEVVTYKTSRSRRWRNYQLAVSTFTAKANTAKLVGFLNLLEKAGKAYRIYSINIIKIRGRNPYLRVNLEVEALVLQEKQTK